MALEKKWRQILPVNIVSNGPKLGSLVVENSSEFKVGMDVILKASTRPDILLEIKSINNNVIFFGKPGVQNQALSDVSLYSAGTVESPEQDKKPVPEKDQSLDRYERGPINADRVVLVDDRGNFYSVTNPLEVRLSDGSINIGTVNAEIETQLSHRDNYPDAGDVADSVRIGNGINEMSVNDDGSINTKSEVTATDLDIRNLSAPTDNVAISNGTYIADVTSNKALKVDGSAVTQPISAASLPLPVGAATENTLSIINNKITQNYGAASAAIRTAAQIGNSTGPAAFNVGDADNQTIRTVIATNQPKIPVNIVDSNGNPNDLSHPVYVNGNVNASILAPIPGINPDAFGRLRVGEPYTLGDYKHLYALDSGFLDFSVNGGTITFNANKACAVLSTSNNPLSRALHQTRLYHHYQPGKSQLILSSVCFGYAQRNITKRTGYFDDRDGIYFEQAGSDTSNATDNGVLSWVIRSYTDGFPNEASVGSYLRRVPQSLWNKDRCDGSGGTSNPSGFNINTSKDQLIWIDFQWLGVGRVRCGFVHNGEYIVAHEYYHSNVLSDVYISNPNLPVRCEIFNTGITLGGSFNQICSTVESEGGYVESGVDFSAFSPIRTTNLPGQTKLPVIAIKLKNTFNGYLNRMSVRPNSLALLANTNSIVYEIIKLPSDVSLSTTLNNGVLTWISADDHSGVEYCINATSYVAADADPLSAGFVPSGNSQNSLSPLSISSLTSSKKNVITQNFDSTGSEVYVVVASTAAPGNIRADVSAALQWREIY